MQKTNKKTQINVLLVDDDQQFLETAKECLNHQGGLNVEIASSSKQALEKMKKKNVDVIVCDIQMPGTTGFEFLKVLRNDGNTIPFIVFTITDKKEVALEAFMLGANGFIGKCGNPSVVYPKLKQCIENAAKNSVKREESDFPW